jgi:uroporphyrinogen-III synthase
MRVIVTRPLQQAQTTVAALLEQGIDAVALPLIDIVPLQDVQPVQQAWRELEQFACVMFVSANAVLHFMRQRPLPHAWPLQVLAASTGPGTSLALRQAGVPPAALVEPADGVFDSEALWLRLKAHDWTACRVLVVRGEGGRDWLAEQLGAAGARLQFVAAYDRAVPTFDAGGQALLRQALAQPSAHLWTFSSSQALAHLKQLAHGADWSQARAVASHPRIGDSARQMGFGLVELGQITPGALAAALRAARSRHLQSRAP